MSTSLYFLAALEKAFTYHIHGLWEDSLAYPCTRRQAKNPRKLVLLKRASLDIQNKKLNCSTEESWILCSSAVGKLLTQRTIQLSKISAHARLLGAWSGSSDAIPHSP